MLIVHCFWQRLTTFYVQQFYMCLLFTTGFQYVCSRPVCVCTIPTWLGFPLAITWLFLRHWQTVQNLHIFQCHCLWEWVTSKILGQYVSIHPLFGLWQIIHCMTGFYEFTISLQLIDSVICSLWPVVFYMLNMYQLPDKCYFLEVMINFLCLIYDQCSDMVPVMYPCELLMCSHDLYMFLTSGEEQGSVFGRQHTGAWTPAVWRLSVDVT